MVRDVAVILLYNKENKILFQHRTDDAPSLPGCWAFFGGGIEDGETPEEGIVRETKEELGYTLGTVSPVYVQDFLRDPEDPAYSKKYIFVEPYDETQSIILGEGQGYAWYKISETYLLKMGEHDQEALALIEERYPQFI